MLKKITELGSLQATATENVATKVMHLTLAKQRVALGSLAFTFLANKIALAQFPTLQLMEGS